MGRFTLNWPMLISPVDQPFCVPPISSSGLFIYFVPLSLVVVVTLSKTEPCISTEAFTELSEWIISHLMWKEVDIQNSTCNVIVGLGYIPLDTYHQKCLSVGFLRRWGGLMLSQWWYWGVIWLLILDAPQFLLLSNENKQEKKKDKRGEQSRGQMEGTVYQLC